MATRQGPNPEGSLRNLIAVYLRTLRDRAGLSGEEFGRILGMGKSAVSKLEAATLHLDRKQASTLDRHFDTGGLLGWLVVLELRERRHQRRSLDYQGLEAEATTVKTFDALVVSSLLQTEDYATAMIATAGGSAEDTQTLVRARLSRQEVLARPSPPLVLVLMAETVLAWPVGGPAVMAGQLAHLLEVGQSPNVSVRVVPTSAGANLGLDGSFKVLSGPTGHIGYTEAPGADQNFTFSLDAQSFLDRYDRIGQHALSKAESFQLIDSKRKEYADGA